MENLHVFKEKEKITEIKEHLVNELETLGETQLHEVEGYISFLKFRSLFMHPKFDEEEMAKLYEEFGEEDRKLAEEGIEEYANSLKIEDNE